MQRLQNQFFKKLIGVLISQPIFKIFIQIEGYFNANLMMYDLYLYYLFFNLKKLNFKTSSVTFYFFP